jgi:hypothetical protein
MKEALLLVAANLGSLACIGGAIWLAAIGNGNWGWFLVCGLVLGGSISFSNRDTGAETADEEAAGEKSATEDV